VRLRAELHKQVAAAAAADQRSISNWIAMAAKRELAKAAAGDTR